MLCVYSWSGEVAHFSNGPITLGGFAQAAGTQ